MVYVRLIREEESKIICETLNLHHGIWRGAGLSRIVLSENLFGTTDGYGVTKEDFDFLYRQKHKMAVAESAAKQTAEETQREKELEELRTWKSEIGEKNFIQQVISLWKLRKRKTGGGKHE